MSAPWDVVVGARVAGASTGLLLARSGLRVLCLERARVGSDTISTRALWCRPCCGRWPAR
jgi:glycine/D-amino acid oxidase-like deaminating enzyme